jgi:hypothetical protein
MIRFCQSLKLSHQQEASSMRLCHPMNGTDRCMAQIIYRIVGNFD